MLQQQHGMIKAARRAIGKRALAAGLRGCGSADLKVSDIAGDASVIGRNVEIIFSSSGARLERDLRQLGCAHDQRLVGALRLRHSAKQEFAAACRPQSS